MDNITINNFGENGYIAFRESDKNNSYSGMINNMTYHPFSGSKNTINTNDDIISNDILTKFYIISISFIGLYIFHNIFFPNK